MALTINLAEHNLKMCIGILVITACESIEIEGKQYYKQ